MDVCATGRVKRVDLGWSDSGRCAHRGGYDLVKRFKVCDRNVNCNLSQAARVSYS